jgi:hypothetical protein
MWATHDEWRARVGRGVFAGLAVTVVIAPWVGPNLVRFDEPVLMSTNDGLTLVGANSEGTYRGGGLGFWSPDPEYFALTDERFADGDASVASRIMREDAVEFIRDNLDDVPRVIAARVGRLYSVYRPLQMADLNTQEGKEVWASHLAFVAFFTILPFAVVGWWRLGRDGGYRWPLTAMVVHVTVVAALFYGIPRFRVPADVAFVVAAAIGIRWLASLGTCPPPPTSSSPVSSSPRSSSSTPSSARRS